MSRVGQSWWYLMLHCRSQPCRLAGPRFHLNSWFPSPGTKPINLLAQGLLFRCKHPSQFIATHMMGAGCFIGHLFRDPADVYSSFERCESSCSCQLFAIKRFCMPALELFLCKLQSRKTSRCVLIHSLKRPHSLHCSLRLALLFLKLFGAEVDFINGTSTIKASSYVGTSTANAFPPTGSKCSLLVLIMVYWLSIQQRSTQRSSPPSLWGVSQILRLRV